MGRGNGIFVRIGLNSLQKISPLTEAVIFMVCDQPYVSSSLLNDLIHTQKETGKSIVTCNYGRAIGRLHFFINLYLMN
jgi:molybdenum cofactor cytidylyltransferase